MIARRLQHVLAACAVALTALTAAAPSAPPAAGSAPIASAALASSTASASGRYELRSVVDPSKPVRWLACRPVEFRIDTADMPPGMIATVRTTMAGVAKQTGVRFRYAGRTSHGFDATTHADVPTIYFAFTRARHAAGRTFGGAAGGGEVGVGGPAAAWYRDGSGRTFEAMTYGRVLLSSRFDAPRLGAGVTWQTLILHEVGHALNLAHRGGPSSVMHPMLTAASPARYTASEAAALRRVLQTTGCDYAAWSRL
ncbi:hypothetical protein [uncultured Amnibacterium sp.]|uniref:hypothetical protein n=1 Tax=uncultured Amnibacterium sp. TaxID=1631851 RepID=UPI0035CC5289